MTFHEACAAIVRNKDQKSLNWAVNYAKAGLSMSDAHAMKVQARYIVGNIAGWRGDEAKMVRATLKEIGGMK